MKQKIKNKSKKHIHSNISLLQDLRKSLIISFSFFVIVFLGTFVVKDYVYKIITKPIFEILHFNDNLLQNSIFIYTNIFEKFFTDISICMYCSLILSIPVFLICLYRFFAPSLYDNEKKVAKLLGFSGVLMMVLSICLLYFLIFPNAINYFVLQEINSSNQIVKPMFKISEYVSTFFHLVIGFGLIFQAPLIIFCLVKFGIIKQSVLSKNRRLAVVIIFIISAIITPPDVISQIICAVILIVVYEITNLIIKKTAQIKKQKRKNSTS